MDEHAWLRMMHVTGALLLLGNVMVTGFWAAFLYRSGPAVQFRRVARGIMWADAVFTLGGGALLTISGVLLAGRLGLPPLDTPWLLKGIVALAIATSVWLVILLPLQIRLERIAPTDQPRLRRTFLQWSVIGWADTAILLYGLLAMVTKR